MRKFLGIIAAAVFFSALVAGCGNVEEQEAPQEPVGLPEKIFELQDYPKCDGAALALPMSEAVCAALTGEEIKNVHKKIVHNGSEKALENLLSSNADIIFIPDSEDKIKEAAQNAGIEVEIVPVAREYYIFYTTEDAEPDTSGETGDDAGAAEKEDEQPGITAEEAESVLLGTSSTNTKYEYGYFLSGFIPEKIQIIAVDGICPSAETVESGEYTFTLFYNAVIRADSPADSGERKIIDAMLDEKGQHLLEEAGYVKL
ncbi:MAG: hypothetical protein Q4C14_08025 [Bacillota bacterium]|nr:hypothetical protein [Bacillota bacterium]